jgi:magnesium chelatase subunit D
MTSAGVPLPGSPNAWTDALLVARLFAADPHGTGGIVVRAGAGPVRDRWIEALTALLPGDMPVRRMPGHIDDDRLLGGLDLAATLHGNRPVMRAGLLAEAHGGVLVVPMAERMDMATAGRIAAAMDGADTRFGLVLLDEGVEPDERAPDALAERMAFRIDLTNVGWRAAQDGGQTADADLTDPVAPDAAIETLCATAAAFGIDSARPALLAMRVARLNAAMAGRTGLDRADIVLAARLVLAPRATQLPAPPGGEDQDQADDAPEKSTASGDNSDDAESEAAPDAMTDIVLEATRAALPDGVMAIIEAGGPRRASANRSKGSGALRKSMQRGRPAGVRAGDPRGGARLSLIDTLRAAAVWQPVRRRDVPGRQGVIVRREDFRVKRFIQRAESTTIFVVDASGSAALQRLAETKGAVELLLAEAYVARRQVALIAFRGAEAEILLPPTRSLARAKRCLADLAGGGGTPLAAAFDAAHLLALAARGKGRTPFVVMLTDGRANIARDGSAGRPQAEADALASAARFRADGIAAVFLDTAPRPRPESAAIATALGARYAALPRVDAQAMRDVVSTLQAGA